MTSGERETAMSWDKSRGSAQPGESPAPRRRITREGETGMGRRVGEEKEKRARKRGGGGGTYRLLRHSVCHTDHTHQVSGASTAQPHPLINEI